MKNFEIRNSTYTLSLLILTCQVLGQVGYATMRGSPIESFLFLNLGIADAISRPILFGILAVLAIQMLTAWVINFPLLMAGISLYFVSEAALKTFLGGDFGAPYAIPAHAIRFLLPLGIAFFLSPNCKHHRIGIHLIKYGISLTFLAHGLEAIFQHPQFIDFLIKAPRDLIGYRLAESDARMLLVGIGVIDIGVALLLFLPRTAKIAAIYMVAWGAITAGARLIHWHENGVFPFMVRAAHWGVPLILLMARNYTSNTSTSTASQEEEPVAPPTLVEVSEAS